MGCTSSKSVDKAMSHDQFCINKNKTIPYLTEIEKVVIQNNWQGLKLHIANIGVMTYVSMFESHPELIRTFSSFEGKDVNKLQDSGLLQRHAVRVMSTIDKCITHINEPSSMRYILQEVGERHKMYNVCSNDIQVILPHFLNAMKPYSQDPWCEELQAVWTHFLTLIVYHITMAMQQNDNGDNVDVEENKILDKKDRRSLEHTSIISETF